MLGFGVRAVKFVASLGLSESLDERRRDKRALGSGCVGAVDAVPFNSWVRGKVFEGDRVDAVSME